MTPLPRVAVAAALALGLIACSSGSKTPTQPNSPAGTPVDLLDNPLFNDAYSRGGLVGVAGLGGATIAIDASGEASVLPLRGVAQTDDSYLLSLQNFFSAKHIRITNIESQTDDLVISYSIKHPFPAPADLSAPANGSTNRADLGITGRAVFLADVASATGNTYFGDVVANTALFGTPDGYIQPAGTIPQASSMTANAFPYKLIVDESLASGNGNRDGVSNSGSPTGNYRPTDGWQGVNMGATRDQWSGFDYLHQGQSASNFITLDKSAIAGGFSFDLVILAKYTDPRGGTTSAQKRANRLPSSPASTVNFVYRMPYGALDVARSIYRGETGGLTPNVPLSSTDVRFTVRDWDARATETTRPDVSDDSDPTTVEVGGSGIPTVEIDIPGVTTSTVAATLMDDDSAIGGDATPESGQSDDPLFFQASVLNTAGTGGQTAGPVTGMARVTDITDSADRSTYEFPLTPDLALITNAADKPKLQVFQAFQVGLGGVANDPPMATVALQGGSNPVVPSAGNVVFLLQSESDTESDVVLYDVDTAYSGSFVPDVSMVDPAAPPSTLYTGTAPTNMGASNLAVEARVRYYDAAHSGSPIEIILPYEVAPAGANIPPTATITLQGGPNPTIPSGGSLQFNLTAENDPDMDNVTYDIMYNYTGVYTADVAPFDPAGTAPLTLHTSTPLTNPGPGPSARTARVRYWDPLRMATPLTVDLPYTIADPSCALATNTYLFPASAEGWVGGETFGLPNGDDDSYGNFSQVTTCTEPAVETASGGLMSGNYWGCSWDDVNAFGTCGFPDDYGANADYNLVSPLLVVPAMCGAMQVSAQFDLFLYANSTASIQVYTSVDEGCNWVAQGTPIAATGAQQTLANQTVTFTGINAGDEVLVRFRFRDTSTLGFADYTAGYSGAWLDNIRLRATSAGSWSAGTPNPPPTTYFSDNFEGVNNWSLYGLAQTDAAVGCVSDPGPWGGWTVCAATSGFVTGNAMTVGWDQGACNGFYPGDMAHSSDFNIVSPPIDLTSVPGTAVVRFDEITGLTQGTLIMDVYMAQNPAMGNPAAWGTAIGTFTHVVGEAAGSAEVEFAIPPALLGQSNVRVRINARTLFATTADVCTDFGTPLTVLSPGNMGFDNFAIREPRCP